MYVTNLYSIFMLSCMQVLPLSSKCGQLLVLSIAFIVSDVQLNAFRFCFVVLCCCIIMFSYLVDLLYFFLLWFLCCQVVLLSHIIVHAFVINPLAFYWSRLYWIHVYCKSHLLSIRRWYWIYLQLYLYCHNEATRPPALVVIL